MTEEQRKKCHIIIHSHAAAAAAGNAIPIPGVGIAADLVTMTTMTLALSKIFEADTATTAKITIQKVGPKVIGQATHEIAKKFVKPPKVITKNIAEEIAKKALKKTILKSPIKSTSKEAAKIIPFLGVLISTSMSVAMLEKAGWDIANELERIHNQEA